GGCRIEERRGGGNGETGQKLAGAGCVQATQGNEPRVPAALQIGQGKTSRQHDNAGERLTSNLLEQPAQFRVHESAEPGRALVLNDLGSVEDDGPAVAAKDRQ